MTWNGDISKMGRLAENIGKLASVPSRASARVANNLRPLIKQEFTGQADPYGQAWKPLAESTVARKGHPTILEETHAMIDSLRVAPMRGAGVGITIDHPAEDHQTGWSGPQGTGPARPILPARGMPPLWKEAIDSAITETIGDTLKRGAA